MKYAIAAMSLILVPGAVLALNSHAQHTTAAGRHPQHQPSAEAPGLREGGQASFAAIQEIVSVLEADRTTDWSKVNVERLRRHLIDMDNVMMRSQVETVPIAGGARFNVQGAGDAVGSVQRMIEGHASTVNGETGWTYQATKTDQGGILEVTSPRGEDAAKIRSLGFAGLLARGNHHQPHHLAMAAGRPMHH